MNATPDGQFQTYSVETGAYIRENFFGGDPRLRKMVEDLTDEEIQQAAARWPRLPQGLRGVQGRHRARRPADGDPRQDHQGLDDRGPRGPQRHPPDEEAHQGRPEDVPRPALPADQRRGDRQRATVAPFYHPGDGLAGDPVHARAPPPARRPAARAPGRPDAAQAARRRDVRRAQAGLGQAGDRHDDGVRPAAARPDEGPGDRPPHRADRARRVPHVRHGLDVPDGEDLLARTASSTSRSTARCC